MSDDAQGGPRPEATKKPSLWQRFKSWPLIARIAAGMGAAVVGLFTLIMVAGIAMTIADPDGSQARADEAEREARYAAEEQQRQDEEEAEQQRQQEQQDAEAEEQRQQEEAAAAEAAAEAEREAEQQRQQEEEEAAAQAEEEQESGEAEEATDNRFEVEHDDFEHDGLIPGGTTTVRFDISDNFSRGLVASGAETDTCTAIEHALEEQPDTGRIVVEGSFPMMDEYGNEGDSIIIRPHYDRSTIDQIDMDNCRIIDIWDVSDGGMIHPDMAG